MQSMRRGAMTFRGVSCRCVPIAKYPCNFRTLPNADVDVEQSLSQGGITVDRDLEQLDRNSVCSNSISVCNKACSIYNFQHSHRRVFRKVMEVFGDLVFRRETNYRDRRLPMSDGFNVPFQGCSRWVLRSGSFLPCSFHPRNTIENFTA